MPDLKKIILITALGISLTGCSRIHSYFERREITKRISSYLEIMEADRIKEGKYLSELHKKYGPEITASELKKDFPKHVIRNLIQYSGHESFTDEELLLIKDFKQLRTVPQQLK